MKRCASGFRRRVGLVFFLVAASRLTGSDTGMDVPAVKQIVTLLSAFQYDRGLKKRLSPEMRIGILYSPTNPASVAAGDEVAAALDEFRDRRFMGLPVRYRPIQAGGGWQDEISGQGINILYIAPGLDTQTLDSIPEVSDRLHLVTTTGVLEYAEEGVACWGIYEKHGRAKLIVNLPSCRSAGCDLDSRLFRLVRVVR